MNTFDIENTAKYINALRVWKGLKFAAGWSLVADELPAYAKTPLTSDKVSSCDFKQNLLEYINLIIFRKIKIHADSCDKYLRENINNDSTPETDVKPIEAGIETADDEFPGIPFD